MKALRVKLLEALWIVPKENPLLRRMACRGIGHEQIDHLDLSAFRADP